MFVAMKQIVETAIRYHEKKIISVAAAHSDEILDCTIEAWKLGLAEFILIGDVDKMVAMLAARNENAADWTLIHAKDDKAAAKLAVQMVREGKADIPMKGILHTSVFMKEILNKETGLVKQGDYVSAVTVAELPEENRLILVTDPVMSIKPEYADKIKITSNAIKLANALGFECPKIAFLSAVEVVNPTIASNIDAAALSKAADRGQLGNCVGDGPLALDVAISEEAARTKKCNRSFQGGADILVVPDLDSGNILDKALRYFAHYHTGSALIGTQSPVVATSRSDPSETKLYTIAIAVIYSHAIQKLGR